MKLRRSIWWAALAAGTLAGVIALGLGLARWHVHSLDEQGRALVAEGQYVPAVRVLLQAVVEAPGDARAHYYLGLAYAGIGLCGAAWLHFEEAMRLAPVYRPLRAGLGPACRGPVARPAPPGQFNHAVHRDR